MDDSVAKAVPTECENMINVPEWDTFQKDTVLVTLVDQLLQIASHTSECHKRGQVFDVRPFTAKAAQIIRDQASFVSKKL